MDGGCCYGNGGCGDVAPESRNITTMKNKLFLSLAAAAVIGLAGVSATAMADPQVNNGMPGIVMSGSQNYNKVPEKARKFVDRHFKGVGVSKCEQYFAKGKYEVELANGVDIDFNTKGDVLEIDAPDNAYLAPAVVKELLHRGAYGRLVKDGLADNVESIEFHKGKAVEVEVDIQGPDTYIFDLDGNFVAIED